MKELQAKQEEALGTINWSILFLVLLIVGVLLSFSATLEQRRGLAESLRCHREDTTDVSAKRWAASALIVGTTGFFAWLACRSAMEAQRQETCVEQRSAQANLLASVLVFAAALVRLGDLKLMTQAAA